MSDEGKVTTERREHTLLIGLDRAAKRNAFDLPLYHALCQAYTDYERDDDLRCGVLFAHGDHFTAGIDLMQWAPAFARGRLPLPEGTIDPLNLGLGAPGLHQADGRRRPGHLPDDRHRADAGGDVRVAAEDTRFAQIEVKRGIYPVGGATLRFPAEAGWGNAMRYLLTGDEFGAQDALSHRAGAGGRPRRQAGRARASSWPRPSPRRLRSASARRWPRRGWRARARPRRRSASCPTCCRSCRARTRVRGWPRSWSDGRDASRDAREDRY